MRFNVLKSNLAVTLTTVKEAVGGASHWNTQITHVKLVATPPDRLMLTTTDLQFMLEVTCSALVREGGAICVPHRLLAELVQAIPADTLTLETDKTTLLVQGGRYRNKVEGVAADDYPAFPTADGTTVAAAFVDHVDRVAHSACQRENYARPVLEGVSCEIGPNGFCLVAADGHRLSRCQEGDIGEGDAAAIMPARSLAKATKLLRGSEDLTASLLGESWLVLGANGTRAALRLIEGNYPDHMQVIPTQHTVEVRANRQGLLRALRTVSTVDEGRPRGVVIHREEGENLVIKTLYEDLHQAEGRVEAQISGTFSGAAGDSSLLVALNTEFLDQAVRQVRGEEVILALNSPNTPVTITGSGEETVDVLHVLMPLQLDRG